ncbi:MAG: hypothetical protein HQ592_18265 [Planctomycetes bacterium]|nr:hypothetical protein [Planctomycetota bacterium]
MKRCVYVACAVLMLALLGGCNALYIFQGKHMVKAQYKPKGRTMLIVPFKDPAYDYFESDEGSRIALTAGVYIQLHEITPFKYAGYLPASVRAAFEQHKSALHEAVKAVADVTDCELVLIGQIEELPINNPRNVGVVRGYMKMSAQLYDVADGANVVWSMPHEEIVYPEGREYDWGIPETDLSLDTLRQKLLEAAGKRIGKAFHDHLENISD